MISIESRRGLPGPVAGWQLASVASAVIAAGWRLAPAALATLAGLAGLIGTPDTAGADPAPAPAELVLRGGKLVTLDPAHPSATALAAAGGRIVALGTDAGITPWIGPTTRVIDLGGRLAVPGFIEGHGHFTGLGRMRRGLDLTACRTWKEVVDKVAERARSRPAGEWILGRGWHQEKWAPADHEAAEGFPTHRALSEAVPGHPVWLTHASGHAAIGNARAMKLAGVTRDTADPPGGQLVRFADGAPTGVFRETAKGLVERAVSSPGPGEWRTRTLEEIELAGRECLAKGLTSFHDAGTDAFTIELFDELARAGRLPLRLWVMIRAHRGGIEGQTLADDLVRLRRDGVGDGFLTVRCVKISLDGALGSHGAWLLAPYTDLPDLTGLETVPVAELEKTARMVRDHDYQLAVHAIGDRANREVLDIYQRVLGEKPGTGRRWRIEHAQHLDPADVPRFGALGVVASMQGIHCTSDGPWVVRRLGEERARRGAYLWRSLLDTKARVINGTDAPVEDVDPLACFAASVTRRLADGSTFFPGQRMTRMEALRSYTADAAWAAFQEDELGTLTRGKRADVTVLSQDLLEVPDEALPATKVVLTVLAGRVAYSSGAITSQ